MDFALNEEQQAISELAGQVIGDASTNERLRELEKADGPRFDAALWASLAETGILGAFLPEEHGGAGLDLIALGGALEHLYRIHPVLGLQHRAAEPLEDPHRHLPDEGLVFDEQYHPAHDALQIELGRGARTPGGILDHGGQTKGDGGPRPRFAVQRDLPAVVLDRAVGHRQPQAGPLPLWLGGEEWIEGMLLHVVVHPFARVPDTNQRLGQQLVIHGRGTIQKILQMGLADEGQRSLARHGIRGVEADVHQHVVDLSRIPHDGGELRVQAGFDVDALVQGPFEDLGALDEDVV